jgi:hypothetical protein
LLNLYQFSAKLQAFPDLIHLEIKYINLRLFNLRSLTGGVSPFANARKYLILIRIKRKKVRYKTYAALHANTSVGCVRIAALEN